MVQNFLLWITVDQVWRFLILIILQSSSLLTEWPIYFIRIDLVSRKSEIEFELIPKSMLDKKEDKWEWKKEKLIFFSNDDLTYLFPYNTTRSQIMKLFTPAGPDLLKGCSRVGKMKIILSSYVNTETTFLTIVTGVTFLINLKPLGLN